jgi:FlaA1/EpsC-like NDP-sugar epimerase
VRVGVAVSLPDVLLAPVRTLRARKRAARYVADCLLWIVALYAAVLIRLDFELVRLDGFEVGLLIPATAIFQLAAGYWNGLYRGWWINGSFEEVAALARTAALTTAGLLLVDVLFPDQHLAPVSAVLAAGIIAFVAMGGARYGARQLLERRRRELAHERARARAIVFGAGEGGERIIRAMLSDSASHFIPVALLDDDPSKRNLTIRGVRVAGDRDDVENVARRFDAHALIIAVPTADGAFVRELTARARAAELDVRVVPSVTELLGGDVSVTDLRAPTEADLLGRHKVETDLLSVSEYVRGKTVVVTGAGGSIGSELCRQLSRFEPGRLVMVDRDESGLHGVQLSLEGRALLDSDGLVLLDIRDRARVARLFAEIRPDVVFHAAALKHLPLLESHPAEALKTNVWGTLAVLDAAAGAGVSLVVNISTDKAADAQSVLGYSKRVAEGLTAHFGVEHPGRYLSVRFGNVLGSRGSVLTAFRAQIEQGGPLTVTDPEVTRYFMTIEEAVQLVIQAGAIGGDGQALVLDMGEPVKIHDVARQLAAACTPEIPIEFTGLRPGEKLHEALFCSHELPRSSPHELIRSVEVAPFDPDFVRDADPTRTSDEVLAQLRAWTGVVDELSRGLPAGESPELDIDLAATERLEDEAAAL